MRFCRTPESESPELYTIDLAVIPFAWTHASSCRSFALAALSFLPSHSQIYFSARTTTRIFESEGLVCKIFRTKELAVLRIIYKINVQVNNYLIVCMKVKGENEKKWSAFPIFGTQLFC
jgi:hypothetical protein